jgi:2-polyprenyl-3-methyl-5-hydroxy-6-metoxy-1,4-benzoquinol methylase
MKISGGLKEEGIVIGNAFDKYGSTNPIVKYMMKEFSATLSDMVAESKPSTIHEVGCGEGYWVCKWVKAGIRVLGTDFSSQVIEIAKENALLQNVSPALFEIASIYELEHKTHSADLVVCCEVFEHLENPSAGFEALQRVVSKNLILSVPREPLWRLLNVARFKYLKALGNTPGHIQHWSKRGFLKKVSNYFEILDVRSPLPWTMVLCRRKK